MKNLIFLAVLLVSQSGMANDFEKIFRCFTPISPLDPNFEQGSQVFIDVFYNKKTNESYLLSKPAEAKNVILYTAEESVLSRFNVESSTIYLSWVNGQENSYASMVYIGRKQWGTAIELSWVAKQRDPSLQGKNEVELICKESQDLLSVLQ